MKNGRKYVKICGITKNKSADILFGDLNQHIRVLESNFYGRHFEIQSIKGRG